VTDIGSGFGITSDSHLTVTEGDELNVTCLSNIWMYPHSTLLWVFERTRLPIVNRVGLTGIVYRSQYSNVSQLQFTNIQLIDAGTYRCEMRNGSNVLNITTVEVTVVSSALAFSSSHPFNGHYTESHLSVSSLGSKVKHGPGRRTKRRRCRCRDVSTSQLSNDEPMVVRRSRGRDGQWCLERKRDAGQERVVDHESRRLWSPGSKAIQLKRRVVVGDGSGTDKQGRRGSSTTSTLGPYARRRTSVSPA
jgi:hypothetical protein